LKEELLDEKNKLRRGFQLGLTALAFQSFLSLAFYYLYSRLGTPLALSEALHSAVGIPISALIFLLYHQRYRSFLEREEAEELTKREGRMFKGEESSLLVSSLRLRQTEKWLIPIVTLFLAVALLYLPVRIILTFKGKTISYTPHQAVPLLLIGLTFLIFLFSRYLLGMAKRDPWKEMRVAGAYLGVNALVCFLIAVSIGFKIFKLPKVEWFLFYLLNILLFIIGMEYLLNLLVSFYRTKKDEKRLAFDSRILLLLSTPEEVIPVFSEILDYQFGFRITQTWFYQFLKKRIIPLLLLQGFLLYILTCIIIIKPYQRAFIEFLGKPVNQGQVFGPGLHFKFPFPIGKARIFDVDRVKSVQVGLRGEEGARFIWTEKHYEEEFNWIIASSEGTDTSVPSGTARDVGDSTPGAEGTDTSVASGTVPVNFLSVTMWIYYQIDESRLYEYCYKHANPETALQSLVYNQFTAMVMNVDFFEIMSVKRLNLGELLKIRIQEEADKHHLGVRVLMVSMEGVHPPVEVAESFEKVVGATEKKEAYILEAEAYKNRELTLADYESTRIRVDSESYKDVRTLESEARGAEFLKKLYAYQKSPYIFKYRYFLKAMENSLTDPSKYVILSSDRERNVTILNLEKTALPDILSLGLEAEKGEKKK
jgi:modulator of FtsH protease HflK